MKNKKTTDDSAKLSKLVEQIATGPWKSVDVNKNDYETVLKMVSKKYWGAMTFFVFGSTAHIIRDRKAPMKLKS